MYLHDIFFWAACFFLMGVLIASIASGFAQPYLISAIGLLFLIIIVIVVPRLRRASRQAGSGQKPLWFLAFILVAVFGSAYYFIYDFYQQPVNLVYGQKEKMYGVVVEAEQRLEGQKVVVELYDNKEALVQITTQRYPKFDYGDLLEISGKLKEVPPEAAGYFSKEGIAGLVSFPNINLISKNNGSAIKAQLLKFREFLSASYKKVLPFERAVFLAGLTLGETAEFSDQLKEEFRITGTSHLVALSGQNIAIILGNVSGLLSVWWLTKRFSFFISTLFVISFVLMTGAEASVVRAAIMAFIVLMAERVGRIYYLRNALVAAALAMVLANPKVLVFDVGFQLSFAALMGIVYLKPLLEKFRPFRGERGWLNWRENFRTTTSAQLAVLPFVLYHFSYFSPIGLVSNLLLLEFIPLTTILGFLVGLAAIISTPLSWLFSLPTGFLLAYELWTIHLFSKL